VKILSVLTEADSGATIVDAETEMLSEVPPSSLLDEVITVLCDWAEELDGLGDFV